MGLLLSALFGFISIITDVLSAHYLKYHLPNTLLSNWHTAVTYNQLYALVILGLSAYCQATSSVPLHKSLTRCILLFSTSTALFCISIYVGVLTRVHQLFYITPIGGSLLIISWIYLIKIALCQFIHDQHS